MSATEDVPAPIPASKVVPLRRELRASLDALGSLLGAPRVTTIDTAIGAATSIAATWPCGCTANGTRGSLQAIFCRRHRGGV